MDATLRLAWSIHKNPGVYALLLGSGISQSVGVPTGWEVVQDLIRQLREISTETLPESIGYDTLLEMIGRTQVERSVTLARYFEPNDEERRQGKKLPSRAHRAIAQLIKGGYIKVVLTTNFDRLLEIALEEIGVIPTVLRSDDMLEGAAPLRHSPATIVQLHGDYKDVRILNTVGELSSYSQVKNTFLDTVFSEYGLVVCGWSAKWDTALRDAIFRIKQRYYSTYWVEPYALSDNAQEVIRHRNADVITASSDDFFVDLQRKVEALAKLDQEHPLTVAVAVERVKRLLPFEETQIELEDLLRSEGEKAFQRFSRIEFRNPTARELDDYYKLCLKRCLTEVEVPLNMATALCWYGKKQQTRILTSLMNRWGAPRDFQHEREPLRKIPALLLLYAGGMSSLYRMNWNYLRALISEPRISSFIRLERSHVLSEVTKYRIFSREIYMHPFGRFEPMSERLNATLRTVFESYLPQDTDYDNLFDLFEMILAVISNSSDFGWIPHNAAQLHYDNGYEYLTEFWKRGGQRQERWGFLKTFFQGDMTRLANALQAYREKAISRQQTITESKLPDYASIYLEGGRQT